jgi:hypothetical protein
MGSRPRGSAFATFTNILDASPTEMLAFITESSLLPSLPSLAPIHPSVGTHLFIFLSHLIVHSHDHDVQDPLPFELVCFAFAALDTPIVSEFPLLSAVCNVFTRLLALSDSSIAPFLELGGFHRVLHIFRSACEVLLVTSADQFARDAAESVACASSWLLGVIVSLPESLPLDPAVAAELFRLLSQLWRPGEVSCFNYAALDLLARLIAKNRNCVPVDFCSDLYRMIRLRDEETTIRGLYVLSLIGATKVDIVAIAESVFDLLTSGEMLRPFHPMALEILTFFADNCDGTGVLLRWDGFLNRVMELLNDSVFAIRVGCAALLATLIENADDSFIPQWKSFLRGYPVLIPFIIECLHSETSKTSRLLPALRKIVKIDATGEFLTVIGDEMTPELWELLECSPNIAVRGLARRLRESVAKQSELFMGMIT